jgi:hypothetical protein
MYWITGELIVDAPSDHPPIDRIVERVAIAARPEGAKYIEQSPDSIKFRRGHPAFPHSSERLAIFDQGENSARSSADDKIALSYKLRARPIYETAALLLLILLVLALFEMQFALIGLAAIPFLIAAVVAFHIMRVRRWLESIVMRPDNP